MWRLSPSASCRGTEPLKRCQTPAFSATTMMPSGSSCARRGLGSRPMMENLVNNDGTASL
jgi:hypothetical protein